ncbi:MAG: malto-oligosyltrehalose trehalohydrolase [Myxococcota bacterium]
MTNGLQVWAPHAQDRVEVETNGRRLPMHRGSHGWWLLEQPIEPGTEYRFVIDYAEPLPDPRSPHQPEGVHGPSRTVDFGAFRWTDHGFRPPPLGSAVVYELHVGTFTPEGTFEAVVERLPYLRDLGVTHVELMPVNAFPGERGWGYDGVDLFAPQETYGGPAGLQRLVDACHGHGLGVLLDVVYNHLGPDGNYLERFGPYFTDRYHTPWGKAVNLDDRGSDEVRRFFCDNARMWLREYHIDGLRVDAVHAFFDRSAVHFLEQLSTEVHALGLELDKPLVVIAESDLNDPRVVSPAEGGGMGCDAQWSDDFHHAVHALVTGERAGYYADFGRIEDVAKALEHVFVYDWRYSGFRDRHHGKPPEGLSKKRFVGYDQTHDQVGNRARGERLGHLVPTGRLKAAAALVLTSPFVPMLFQGEEWNAGTPFQYFTDHHDPKLGRAVSEGRRREFAAFGWRPEDVPDPQSPATFERSKLRWDELEDAAHRDVLEWYRALIALRHARPDLLTDSIGVRFDENARWLAVQRPSTTLLCNLADAPRRIPLPPDRPRTAVLASSPDARIEHDVAVLPPDSALVLG